MIRIGLISDTHGLLRPEAKAFLMGSRHIVHAGDIGHVAILDELASIAPVTAVLGNNDVGGWPGSHREIEQAVFDEVRVHVLHDLAKLAIDPAAQGVRVVVSGHSHKPVVREDGRVLYVNPGSAGPRRFKLPVTVGELLIDGRDVTARITELTV